MRENTPEFNPILKKGIAGIQLKQVEKRIEEILRMLEKEFPEGLKFEGYRRCTAQEEYREHVRGHNGSSTFDIARSYLYLIRLDMSYKGLPVPPRYVYLPFVDQHDLMYLSDSLYQPVPVLADPRIMVDKDSVFIRPLRAKINVRRMAYPVSVNGRLNQTARIPFSTLYNLSPEQKKLDRPIRMECVLIHYILCRYGFYETFYKYLGVTPVVGLVSTITPQTHPEDEWLIYGSNYFGTDLIPEGMPKGFYHPSALRIAMLKSEVNETVHSYLSAFFYIVDRFPDRIQPEYLMMEGEVRDDGFTLELEKRLWIILLGSAVLSPTLNEGRLAIDFQDHIFSLDRYIDTLSQKQFKRIGVEVSDLYDLFDLVIRQADQWILEGKRNLSSIYGKELNVIDYILGPLIEQIVTMSFNLVSIGKKELPRRTDEEAVKLIEKTMKVLKTGVLFRLTGESGAVLSMNNPGDNRAFKTIMTRQIKAKKQARRNKNDEAILKSEGYQFHVSLMEISGHTNVTKTDPSGRERYNMCMNLSDDFVTRPHPDMKEAFDAVQVQMYPHFRHLIELVDEEDSLAVIEQDDEDD